MMKRNIIFNYIGQFYSSFVGILIFPIYLKYVGGEAYGLIGFFMLLQAWMLLFDLGMSPTLARQVAISNDLEKQKSGNDELRQLLRSLETIFFLVAVIVFISMFTLKYNIASKWLKVSTINIEDVAICIGLMGGMISLRWFSSLYKSGINGYERQVWVNLFNIIIVTLRMPASLIIIFTTKNIVIYFYYQLLISLIEVFFLNRKMYRCLPEQVKNGIPLISWDILRTVLPFAVSTAYTAGIWVFLTQLDKLLLSKILPLATFGIFSMVATLVGGILMLSTPVSNALLPRMTNLLSLGYESEMLRLYRQATKFICCIVAPISLVMIFFPYQVMFAWTGNHVASTWAHNVLPLYAIGNGILAVVGFQYYLQYAYGKLKLHVIYNTVLALISIPAVYFSATKYGAVGTGFVWFMFNLITLLCWTAIVHRKFSPGLHKKWLAEDVVIPIVPALIFFSCLWYFLNTDNLTQGASLIIVMISCVTGIGLSFMIAFYSNVIRLFSFFYKKWG